MSDESVVTFVGGKAIEQSEPQESNLETDEREAAKSAVREAIEKAGKDSADDAKSSKGKDPFKPVGTKSDKVSKEKEASDTSESGERPRGPDGKFLPVPGVGVKGSTERSDTKATKAHSKETEVEDESEGESAHGDSLDPAKASVKELLKHREKVANIKREGAVVKDELSKAREELAQAQAQFQHQQWQFQQEQAQLRKQQEVFQNFRKDPARAVKEFGVDPEQFILDLAQEGTPEGQLRRKQQEIDHALARINQWEQTQLQAQQAHQAQAQQQHLYNQRQGAVQKFVSTGLNEEKYPLINTFYKGHESALVARGDLAARDFRQLSGGREASFEDLLDYIEDQLAERTNSWYTNKYGDKTPVAKKEPASNTKPKSKGKSLNPDASGERRSLEQKSLKDLDADERIEAARQAVKIALANSKSED